MRTLPARPAHLVIALAATLAVPVLLTGCGGDSTTSAPAVPTSSAVSTTSSSSAPSVPATATKAAPAKTSSTAPTPSDTISIPPNLCAATDSAQNTADAFMGALSAGNEKEALACVFGRSVPLSITQSLLGHQSGTAVYLPKDGGADGPSKFDYVGNGKTITVTVTREADHKTWVSGVAVR